MKSLRLCNLLIACFILTVSFSSCKKSNNDESSFTWTFKGVNYTASYAVAHYIEDLGPNIIGGLGTSAFSPGSGPQFKIIPVTEGTHSFGTGTSKYFEYTDTEGYMFPGTGTMTITKSDGELSATFTATVNTGNGDFLLTGTIKNIELVP